jgi:PQQ-like domain
VVSISRRRLRACAAVAALIPAALALSACGSAPERQSQRREQVNAELVERAQVDYQSTAVAAADGPQRQLSELPFDLAWDLPLKAPVHASWIGPETRNLLMVQLVTGEVQCLDVYSGKTLWVTQELPKPITLPPHVHRVAEKNAETGQETIDDRLYIISGDELFVFDCVYGQLIWRHHLGQTGEYGFQPCSGPYAQATDQNLRVFIGDWDGRIRTISRHVTGRGYHAWQWNLLAVPTAQPTGHEGLTYVGDRRGRLHCFGIDREKKWEFDARGAIKGRCLVRGFNLYFGASDNVFHVLNRLSGQEMGKLYLGAEIKEQPFAFRSEPRRVYVWTSNHPELAGLHRLKTLDDRIKIEDFPNEKIPLEVNRLATDWFLPGYTTLVGSSPNHLYLTRPDSSVVVAIDRETGKPDWHWDLNQGREGSKRLAHLTSYHDATDDLRVIVTADHDGFLQVYRLFGHR